MPEHRESRILPYSPEQMFALVSDVGQYKDFLPWCLASRVYNRKAGQFDADLVIGFKMFREKFTSRVLLSEPHKVHVNYIKGPLKTLYNHWHFLPVDQGCKVSFAVDLEFKNPVLERMIGDMFTKATLKMVQAFENRAHELYGN